MIVFLEFIFGFIRFFFIEILLELIFYGILKIVVAIFQYSKNQIRSLYFLFVKKENGNQEQT